MCVCISVGVLYVCLIDDALQTDKEEYINQTIVYLKSANVYWTPRSAVSVLIFNETVQAYNRVHGRYV